MRSREIYFVRLSGFYPASHDLRQEDLAAVIRSGTVLEATSAARRWGVENGMEQQLAIRRCPGLVCTEQNLDRCRTLFTHVWNMLAELTPLVEPLDFHEGFLDLSSCGRRRATDVILTETAFRVRFETALELVWGGGADRWIARLALGENRWIAPAEEDSFLGALPVQKFGLPDELCERLTIYGIRTVGEFLRVPRSFWRTHLQVPVTVLEPLLRRDTQVRALFPPQQIEIVHEPEEGEDVSTAIIEVSHKAAMELAKRNQQCRRAQIVLTSRSGPFVVPHAFSSPTSAETILRETVRRTVAASKLADVLAIRLFLSDLAPAAQPQLALWQHRFPKDERAARCAAVRSRLAAKFGAQTIRTAGEQLQRIKPRFAQLIFEKRGIPLP